jgi:hypothetical protein
VRGTLGRLEGFFQLGNALGLDFELLSQRSVLAAQPIEFWHHLG